MLRETENTPSFPEKGFNRGLDDAQIVKNGELLERFGHERAVYMSLKDLFVAIDSGSDWKRTRNVTAYCLHSLRACGVDLFPDVEDFFTDVQDESEWYRILVFLEGNRDALLNGTYRNDGNLVPSGKILMEDKDVSFDVKVGAYVRKVMPGVNLISGTYPRWHRKYGDGVDEEGVKVVSKGFKFMRDKFLPKLDEALQHFLSSRSEIIFGRMVEVRRGFDKVLRQKDEADRLLGRPIVPAENVPVPEHWIEEYKNFMFQINLMYSVYDRLEDIVFRLSAVASGGAEVEAEIEKTRDKFLGPLLRGFSSRGHLADSLGDALPMDSESSDASNSGRSRAELDLDLEDYLTDAKILMGQLAATIGVYQKASMRSGIHDLHGDDATEIAEFLK